MKPNDFDYVANMVREQSAIVLEAGKEYLVEARLMDLAHKEKLGTVDDLIRQLRSLPQNGLHKKVVDAMTTNETSFFRDHHPFEALKKTILPELIARRSAKRHLSFWCGAASTGQESYSVLMLIAEHFPELLDWDITFIASDLCNGVVERARAGRFSQLEVNRGLPSNLLVKYFARHGAEWEISEDLRRRVDFRQVNIVKEWPALPPLDIVFLRNILIYFDLETRRTVLGRIRRLLRPDGCLILGGSESTLNVDDAYERVVIDKTMVYRVKGAPL